MGKTGGETMSNHVETIGVLTSGGDAPGMNAAMRAVVREALFKGKKVKGISRGYAGLLNEDIFDMTASDVSETISRGGTKLQTARCTEFVDPDVQKMAAEFREVNGSIVCKELLGLVPMGSSSPAPKESPEPSDRTPEYYKKRPCEELVGISARIVGKKILRFAQDDK